MGTPGSSPSLAQTAHPRGQSFSPYKHTACREKVRRDMRSGIGHAGGEENGAVPRSLMHTWWTYSARGPGHGENLWEPGEGMMARIKIRRDLLSVGTKYDIGGTGSCRMRRRAGLVRLTVNCCSTEIIIGLALSSSPAKCRYEDEP